jgi:hypothetical protein
MTAGGAIGAAVLAFLTTTAGGGDATASVGAALDSATSESSIDADTASSRRAAESGDESAAWRRLGLKELKHYARDELRCSVQSFGQVRQFFLRHPCTRLDQLLFVVGDGHGAEVVGSVMWVTMPSASTATQLQALEDTYGTGDVTPIGTEILAAGGIHFTGQHYKSRTDGPLLVIAESEPLHGAPTPTQLQEVATVAAVLPPP